MSKYTEEELKECLKCDKCDTIEEHFEKCKENVKKNGEYKFEKKPQETADY